MLSVGDSVSACWLPRILGRYLVRFSPQRITWCGQLSPKSSLLCCLATVLRFHSRAMLTSVCVFAQRVVALAVTWRQTAVLTRPYLSLLTTVAYIQLEAGTGNLYLRSVQVALLQENLEEWNLCQYIVRTLTIWKIKNKQKLFLIPLIKSDKFLS